MMRSLLALALLGLCACEPETVDKKTDTGWASYTVGVCETRDGLDTGRACTKAAECKAFCCQCANGTEYSASYCDATTGCSDFGPACREVQTDVCGE
jgi:hypothetical protein